MKARNFRYVRPASLAEAVGVLRDSGPEAVVMAGGQSLLAALNMRMSAPSLVVDIGDLPELHGVEEKDGVLRIGSATPHAEILRNSLVRRRIPLMCEACEHIAHVAIRNRGTIGGSLAYADPAAEWPAVMVTLQATFVLASAEGERVLAAQDFFVGLLETALRAGEIITRIDVPIPADGVATAFGELARRHGDFALAGLVATMRLDNGRLVSPRLTYFGCTDHARPARATSHALEGAAWPLVDDALFASSLSADLDLTDAPGLRADTRLQMARALTRRVVNSLARPA